MYATSNPGSTIEASVRPSTRSYGVLHIQNRSYVTIESFEVTQSASFGLYIKPAASYITVKDCEVSHSLDGGLVAPSGRRHRPCRRSRSRTAWSTTTTAATRKALPAWRPTMRA